MAILKIGLRVQVKARFFILMANPNYELKAQVLESGICRDIKKIDRQYYLNCLNGIVEDSELNERYFDLLNTYDYGWILEAKKINKASFNKTNRLREKIKSYLESGPCLWVTLTFTDKTLESTSEDTRKQYVRKYLKSNYEDYIANIDYGSKNGREHYHAIIRTDFINVKEWHQYGAIKVKHIRVNGEDKELSIKRLPKYINKLTNHAVKDTCKRCHIIYSRKPKTVVQ